MRQIVLDTETTGLEYKLGHRIVEIAAVELRNRQLTGVHFHHYLNPDRESDEAALQVHGLTADFLQDKPRFHEISTEFLAFISDAEELGLIGRIGFQVAEQALAQLSHWLNRYGRPLVMALNISAFQLRDPDFVREMRALLARHPGVAQQLELEITETALVHSIEGTPDALRLLSQSGVRVVLDDLGVAYSALSHLKHFQVHGIKLDRGFVGALPDSLVDSAIARSIIALADSLNLRLVAEGIEHEDQREYLLARGCREGQGYLFGRPMCAADMEVMIATMAAAAADVPAAAA